MTKTKHYILGCLLLMLSNLSCAQQKAIPFTLAEQQQISISTPGLFEKDQEFSIDLTLLGKTDYSFPLPVGKATVVGGQALEIATAKGDAVKAMFDGTVRLSRKTVQYGNTIVIRHDNGLETVYARNAQNLVQVGQRVKAGQTIAIVGGTPEKATCMVAIMVNGGWINPAIILNANSHRLHAHTVTFKKQGRRVVVSTSKASATNNQNLSLHPDAVKGDPFAGKSTFELNLEHIGGTHWAYPLPGSHVISPYGGKRHHSGVDIKTKPNDKILAAFDGIVTYSARKSGYGNYITIKHAYGLSTCYSHQSKNFVKVGQHVKAGEVIGLTGRTGRATTEHLHFEVRYNGNCINPATVFNHQSKQLQKATLTLRKNGGVTSKKH